MARNEQHPFKFSKYQGLPTDLHLLRQSARFDDAPMYSSFRPVHPRLLYLVYSSSLPWTTKGCSSCACVRASVRAHARTVPRPPGAGGLQMGGARIGGDACALFDSRRVQCRRWARAVESVSSEVAGACCPCCAAHNRVANHCEVRLLRSESFNRH